MEVNKIKNILTALGNPKINNKIKENINIENFKIIEKDIQYKEGILEFLENNIEINYLIIEQNLPGEIKINSLIKKIQNNFSNIKIIIIMNKYNDEMEDIFKNNNNIFRIIYEKEINIEQLIKIISQNEEREKYNKEIKEEIIKLKENIENKKYKNNEKQQENSEKNIAKKSTKNIIIIIKKIIEKIKNKIKNKKIFPKEKINSKYKKEKIKKEKNKCKIKINIKIKII